jgi:hypothetical protein
MKRPTFLQGIGIAFLLSFFGAALFATFSPMLAPGLTMRLLVALLSFAYVLYLLAGSRERTGRIATMVLWALVAGVTWFATPPLPLYLIIHAGTIWLVRSLYYRSSVLPALLDLGLSGLSLVVAIGALSRSGSIFLSIWCFFLVQALFVAVPSSLKQTVNRKRADVDEDGGFQSAYRTAEAALRRISAGS